MGAFVVFRRSLHSILTRAARGRRELDDLESIHLVMGLGLLGMFVFGAAVEQGGAGTRITAAMLNLLAAGNRKVFQHVSGIDEAYE